MLKLTKTHNNDNITTTLQCDYCQYSETSGMKFLFSLLRIKDLYMFRGNPGGGEIFRTRPGRPWGPPSLLYNGYRVFPGGSKRPGRDADSSPPSSAEV
jgi:hypothetical protein